MSDYLLDVPYTPQFHREHAPLWFQAVLTALGRPQPVTQGASWCEVGCGSGLGLIVLAATNPSTTFHGIDINPEHIAQARALAEEAGIGNVEFRCADLRQAESLPGFDYIVVRGIYSWVSPEVRQAIRRFVGQKLNPGGIALLHYLALPGGADFIAVHSLFRALHLQSGTSVRDSIRAGQDILLKLHEGKAGFFNTHPVAEIKAQQIATDDADYTAHDYLNEYYVPLSSAEVIGSMSQEGLHFAGSAVPFDNLDDFSVPGNLIALFRAQKTQIMRETVRDFASNQLSRVDLYMHAARPLAAAEHFAALRRLRFRALPGAPVKGGLAFDARIGKVEGPAQIFSPILERFAGGQSVSYAEIEALPVFRANPGIVNQALHALLGAGLVHPVPEAVSDPAPARRLNAVLLERHRAGQAVPALAAPALASGLYLQPEDLEALSRSDDVPQAVRHLLP
ncbi:class I SAM-dependent methyltransferase [Rhizobiaceae bacterium BDR2-2]|uniref:Class I SAM-dependent methyltransferase n=1 Tax=Ectorhizobium quercum TaxID=2965071 RepID=A0AAE3MX72_9HYPH|nr:class I SAM-dependent methyltransferase [Ectorhizobium quercum]MCX8995967.1 class I SAM-dependent methyltransferase [Ectorhizobium quercum]